MVPLDLNGFKKSRGGRPHRPAFSVPNELVRTTQMNWGTCHPNGLWRSHLDLNGFIQKKNVD